MIEHIKISFNYNKNKTKKIARTISKLNNNENQN